MAFRYYKGCKPNENCAELQKEFERIRTIAIESKEIHESSMKMIFCECRKIIYLGMSQGAE